MFFSCLCSLGLDGIYVSWGNVPFDVKKLTDIHVWSISSPGVSLVSIMKAVCVPQIKVLQNGVMLTEEQQKRLPRKWGNTDRVMVFVCGGMGVLKADMVDACVGAAHKGHGSVTHPDRMSKATRSDISNVSFDVIDNKKTLQQLRKAREDQEGGVNRTIEEMGFQGWTGPCEKIELDSCSGVIAEPVHSELLGVIREAIRCILGRVRRAGQGDDKLFYNDFTFSLK